MKFVGIVDINTGSLNSIKACMNNLKIENDCFTDPKDIFKYKRVILPGVGNFGFASNILSEYNWKSYIQEFLSDPKRKLMGICLGFQVLFDYSEESPKSRGLGLMHGKFEKLKSSSTERVPHVGWNNVISEKSSSYLNFINEPLDVYFVHSYALFINKNSKLNQLDEYTFTQHGKNKFLSSFRKNNLYGCQFHPEKSSKVGSQFLLPFLNLNA